ncbi:DUF1127 domain-containing protein [Accumulibacter sp.]|uniref:DUF1127 domain-containing protein n=1 Tax=Accumulibacter sp. TaxID=2053492 RepID=UPI001DC1527F|nr:DUF1127 domain-containing protein [Accumulibacter sp.]MCB1893763.1 DUF1127 domain-containing protein [Rhodocyclaceae bacterium]MCP5230200.1 DUF1127 domain-containing protein [Accumulibacter sp.]
MQLSVQALFPHALLRARRRFVSDATWCRLGTTLRLWARRRRGRRELRELDEHILRDVGISRAQARFEGSKPFWRD